MASNADKVKEWFKSYDRNGNGLITPKELAAVFMSEGWSKEDCSKLFDLVDKNHDGKINLEEFSEWVMKDGATAEQILREGADNIMDRQGRKEAAPYLFEYFEIQKKEYKALMDMSIEDMMEIMMDEEKERQFKAKQKAVEEEQLKPLLEKSFRHHDTSGEGLLSREEAKVFFDHFVQAEGAFFQTMMMFHLRGTIEQALQSSRKADKEGKNAALQQKMSGDMDKVKAEIQKARDEYSARKEDKDKAAFAVLDIDGNGTLQLPELMAVLFPESDSDSKFRGFNDALGFGTVQQAVRTAENT